MSTSRKQSNSLDHFDVEDFKPFKPQRVVSFKLYAQEQKSRLTTLYPFLTQEQICLKVKEKWDRMEHIQKQNYTKAVLHATPSRKSEFSKFRSQSQRNLKCNLTKDKQIKVVSSDKGDAGFKPVTASTAKVADWLNDPKQQGLTDRRSKGKTYTSSSYALTYDVPTVIDPTPTKQPGILKFSSSKKKEKQMKKSEKSRRLSHVSFSPKSKAQGKKEMDSQRKEVTESLEKSGKTKTCLESKFTNINEILNFEYKTLPFKSEDIIKDITQNHDKLATKATGGAKKQENCQGLVFDEEIEEQLFTTPEMAKLPLREVSKAPKKRKSSGKRCSSKKKKMATHQEKQIKAVSETEANNTNHNNSNIISDVFGKKSWAASTYSKKYGSHKKNPEKSVENGKEVTSKKDEKYLFDDDKAGIILGPFPNDSDEENRNDFIRNKGGLLVGPVKCCFDEDMEEQPIDSDETDENEINEKCLSYSPQKDVAHTKRHSLSTEYKDNKGQRKGITVLDEISARQSYTCDFHDDTSLKSSLESPKKSEKPQNNARKKSLNEVIDDIMEDDDNEGDITIKEVNPCKPRLVELCKDFVLEEPVSPILSDAADSSLSGSVMEETSSPVWPSGMNPTLMKVLLKMKQITSPDICDMDSVSPKLLSPTLSGITELSSLSTESSATKDNEDGFCHSQLQKSRVQPAFNVKEPVEGGTFPGSKRSHRSTRAIQQSEAENILCCMFQAMTPPETEQKSKRRLISSNQSQKRSNFDKMFEDQNIFS